MSGGGLNRTQLPPSALTAIEDWVRARALIRPLRQPPQLRQLQFHCGNPPPAAEPRMRTLTMAARKARGRDRRPRTHSTRQNVHRDFEAKTNIGKAWFRPHHGCPPGRVEDRLNLRQCPGIVFSNPVRRLYELEQCPRTQVL